MVAVYPDFTLKNWRFLLNLEDLNNFALNVDDLPQNEELEPQMLAKTLPSCSCGYSCTLVPGRKASVPGNTLSCCSMATSAEK